MNENEILGWKPPTIYDPDKNERRIATQDDLNAYELMRWQMPQLRNYLRRIDELFVQAPKD